MHYENLKEGVIYDLGKDALRIFYLEILKDPDSILVAYYTGDKIIGSAASTKDINALFNRIKRNHYLRLAFNVLKKSLHSPSFPIKLLFSKYPSEIKSELLFLFVDRRFREGGIGRELVNATAAFFKKKHVKKFKITVPSSNAGSRKFYSRIGFVKIDSRKFMMENRDILELEIGRKFA